MEAGKAVAGYGRAVLLFVHDAREVDDLELAFMDGIHALGVPLSSLALERGASARDNAAAIRAALAREAEVTRLVPRAICGFSWAARAAATSYAEPGEVHVSKLVCLGFPFHPRGAPQDTSRLSLLDAVPETLILQGERDAHGNRAWVRGRELPKQVRVEWIADGNHRFEPRAASGQTREGNVQRVIELAADFCA